MIRALLLLGKFNKLPEEVRNIVFFSEGKRYWGTFSPIVSELKSQEIPFAFISMEKDDPGLQSTQSHQHSFHIGSGSGFMLFMSMIKADVVALTTPGLQSLTLKRSPGVNHYAHIVHSPTGMAFYRRYSFDHFDSVLCSGEQQIEDIRQLEKVRGTAKKQLFETGCPYTDLLAAKLNGEAQKSTQADTRTILVAPTWGQNGALSRFDMDLLKPLIETNQRVIVRPHPQQIHSEKRLLDSLKRATKGVKTLEWDENPSGHESFSAADIMISDLSGAIFDFAFIYGKPVLTIDFPYESAGFEQQDLAYEPWEYRMREKLGRLVLPDEIERMGSIIGEVLLSQNLNATIADMRQKYLYNYGNSGKVAASQLLQLGANFRE